MKDYALIKDSSSSLKAIKVEIPELSEESIGDLDQALADNAREIIASLPDFFSWLDEGNYYMACAMGLHRTDIAIALYYVFHPSVPYDCVPELRGYRKDNVLRCDDIARRLNSIMNALTPEDLIRLGLPDGYRDEFNRRKKHLFAINSVF